MAKPKTITLSKQDVENIIELCGHDGHSILPVDEFTKAGINPDFVKGVTFTHKSSKSDPKWAITTSKGPVNELTGIYTLTALQVACNLLHLENKAGGFFGRGRQASAYTEALQNWTKTA